MEITERMVFIHHSSKQSQTVEYEKPREKRMFSSLEWSLLLAIIFDKWTKKLETISETEAKTWDLRRHGEGNKMVTVKIFSLRP